MIFHISRKRRYFWIFLFSLLRIAFVAQQVEQTICNHQVAGSSPVESLREAFVQRFVTDTTVLLMCIRILAKGGWEAYTIERPHLAEEGGL